MRKNSKYQTAFAFAAMVLLALVVVPYLVGLGSDAGQAGIFVKFHFEDGSEGQFVTDNFQGVELSGTELSGLKLESVFVNDKLLASMDVYLLLQSGKDIAGNFDASVTVTYGFDVKQTIPVQDFVSLQKNMPVAKSLGSISKADIIGWTTANSVVETELTVKVLVNGELQGEDGTLYFNGQSLIIPMTVDSNAVSPDDPVSPPPEDPTPTPTPSPSASPTPTPSATPSPTPTPTPAPSYLFSDGFESGSFSVWSGDWRSSSSLVSHEVTSSLKHSGSYGYHAASVATSSSVGARVYKSFSSSASDVYFRAYYRVSASFTSDGQYVELCKFAVGGTDVAVASMRRIGGSVVWRLTYSPSYRVSSGGSAGLDSWVCVEMQVHKGISDGYLVLFVNGASVCGVSNVDTSSYWPNLVYAGMVWKSGVSSVCEVWMDDCVVSEGYVGT